MLHRRTIAECADEVNWALTLEGRRTRGVRQSAHVIQSPTHFAIKLTIYALL